jgi:hypothetical protein
VPFFFINNVDEVFRIFQYVSALSYVDGLKLFMIIESVEDCHRIQSACLQVWCSEQKFDLNGLNAANCK